MTGSRLSSRNSVVDSLLLTRQTNFRAGTESGVPAGRLRYRYRYRYHKIRTFMSGESVSVRDHSPTIGKARKERNTVIVVSFTIIAHRFSFRTPF